MNSTCRLFVPNKRTFSLASAVSQGVKGNCGNSGPVLISHGEHYQCVQCGQVSLEQVPKRVSISCCRFQLTVEVFDYLDYELKLAETGESP